MHEEILTLELIPGAANSFIFFPKDSPFDQHHEWEISLVSFYGESLQISNSYDSIVKLTVEELDPCIYGNILAYLRVEDK